MKKLFYLLALLPVLALSQSTDQNWVKSKTYKTATTTAIATPTAGQAVTQVNYFDGLGRPIQQVAHAQSNSGKDIVTHITYDQFGRQTKEFLPYANQTASLNYNSNAGTDVLSFYNTTAFENTQNPFSEKQIEASPLNRVLKQAAPGEAWKLTSGHEIEFDYQTNETNDYVKLYKAIATWNATSGLYNIAFVDANFYANYQLYKTITKDENHTIGNNNTTQEFKNKEGQVVLKRTFNNAVPHDTYYIYDQFGNLTYVIPPAVSGTITQTILDNMCYQYKYDYRNRLVEKKLPGKQWEYIVYDKLDRVVATGPAYNPYGATSESDKGWMLTKYDEFNRPVYTAWYNAGVTSSADRKTLQDSYNNATAYSESKTTSDNIINGVTTRYTNNITPSTFIVLTVNYYDNYLYPNAPSPIPSTLPDSTLPIVDKAKGMPTGSWVRILDTSGSTTNELSYTLYDTKYRPIRSYTKNYLGGYTQVDTKLDWAGKTEYTLTKHKRVSSSTEIVTKDMFEYSAQDKLVKHKHKINALAEQLLTYNTYDELGQLVSKNVGGTDVTGATGLQKVDYAYNIRGWLKSINNIDNLAPSATENDLFAFKLSYNNSVDPNDALYNGNISEAYWRTDSDNVKRKYRYKYDHLNRLLEAKYSKPGNLTTTNNYLELLEYDKNGNITNLIRNGNSDNDGTTLVNEIDQLEYVYDSNNKNLLKKVIDHNPSPQGFKDGVNTNDDFEYDANGNMKIDNNKGITEIIYNHLNLPIRITFGTNGTIEYLYNAVGLKVKKTVTESTTAPVATDYLSGFQYKNNGLTLFPHAEGYVNVTNGRKGYVFNYVFNYTDHLGNVRLSYSDDAYNPPAVGEPRNLIIIEENHYYPFGLKHTNYNNDEYAFVEEDNENVILTPVDPFYGNGNVYNYKYNGKELQEELGLNMYDYGARNYDPSLGRWMNIDPLAEKYYSNTPYNYVNNNPLNFVDPDGRSGEATIKKDSDGNEYIEISSVMYFYGDESSSEFATETASHIQNMWNEAGGTLEIDGKSYNVKFSIKGKHVSKRRASRLASKNKSAKNNFIRVTNGSNWANGVKSSFYNFGDNSGVFLKNEIGGKKTTDAHEMGHGYGWYEEGDYDNGAHDLYPLDENGKNPKPGIMSARGTPVYDEYGYDGQPSGSKTLDPSKRKVLPSDISKLSINTSTLKLNGAVSVGTANNNIYNSNGTKIE